MSIKETREELRAIHQELRKFLPAADHAIRELPGTTDLYIYLPWEKVRDRLEEVVPDYQIEFILPQFNHEVNLVSCVATLDILGVKKQALASVPITQVNTKTNKDMSRGNAVDRLHSEAFKNAAEAHCVGRYLADQERVFLYLWGHQSEIDEETRGKLRKMQQQFKQIAKGATPIAPKKKEEPTMLAALAGVPVGRTISDAQRKRLWAIARSELKLDDATIKEVVGKAGYESTEHILISKYEDVIEKLREAANPPKPDNLVPFQAPSLYPAHNAFIKRLCGITGHSQSWINKQCVVYEGNEPGDLEPSKLRKLVEDMAIDYAVYMNYAQTRDNALTAFQGKVAFFEASGGKFGEGAIAFLEEVKLAG